MERTSRRRIDRGALVRRHNPTVLALDPFAALTVGNGEFAFTADVTGLQTFPEAYRAKLPLCTLSHWGWHSAPLPAGLLDRTIRLTPFDTYGRPVGYATDRTGQEALFDYRRQNPHRLHLGRIGLEMARADGSPASPDDLEDIEQTLDLWTGILHSRFSLEGAPVSVTTCCHPEQDLIAARIESPLVAAGRLHVVVAFPYGSPEMDAADWNSPHRHQTTIERRGPGGMDITRRLDGSGGDAYAVQLGWSRGAASQDAGPHTIRLTGSSSSSSSDTHGVLEISCRFAPGGPFSATPPTFAQTRDASAHHWERFWSEGGALDLSGSADPRAEEMERRVVLSLYHTALHCAGSLPSQETGLLCNSWYGKFHLEMHWWHSVHFVPWNRFRLFERSLGLYERILPLARDLARSQGYQGARWPKMIGPDGHDSPSPVGPLLIWQQPHPIYYAELCYRHAPTAATLAAWRDIVFESAAFMASYAVFDTARQRYVLGPPLKTVSENQDPHTTINPTFELAYWRFGLRVAQQWRERLGLPRLPLWDRVLADLAPLPVQDGRYLLQEGRTDTYAAWNWEHPALLGAFGVQPGDGADRETMRRTVRRVMECWQWDRTWGWDFPMTAMAAARAGEPELAINALLVPSIKNRRLPNGHIYQRENLPAYLPANGGLLAAVGMMAAGWTNGPTHPAPGFPDDGNWSVCFEQISPWL